LKPDEFQLRGAIVSAACEEARHTLAPHMIDRRFQYWTEHAIAFAPDDEPRDVPSDDVSSRLCLQESDGRAVSRHPNPSGKRHGRDNRPDERAMDPIGGGPPKALYDVCAFV
jgi:hypothetical protein